MMIFSTILIINLMGTLMKKILYLTLLFSTLVIAQSTQFFCDNPSKYIVKDSAQKSIYKNCKRDGMTWWFTDKGKIK